MRNNYLIAFLCCVSLSVMAVLTGDGDAKWLIVSDVNVGIWLFVAWLLERERRG